MDAHIELAQHNVGEVLATERCGSTVLVKFRKSDKVIRSDVKEYLAIQYLSKWMQFTRL